jgi:hypothetical protein
VRRLNRGHSSKGYPLVFQWGISSCRASLTCCRSYSITSSARDSNDWGAVSPSSFAVLRLITSSILWSGGSTDSLAWHRWESFQFERLGRPGPRGLHLKTLCFAGTQNKAKRAADNSWDMPIFGSALRIRCEMLLTIVEHLGTAFGLRTDDAWFGNADKNFSSNSSQGAMLY